MSSEMNINIPLNPRELFKIYKAILSPFFLSLFSSEILQIIPICLEEQTKVFKIKVKFSEKSVNFLNIVHGGSIAILIENLTQMLLFMINGCNYRNLDVNFIYKRPLTLDKKYNINVKIEKIRYKTVFINVEIMDDCGEEYDRVIMIKEKINDNKI